MAGRVKAKRLSAEVYAENGKNTSNGFMGRVVGSRQGANKPPGDVGGRVSALPDRLDALVLGDIDIQRVGGEDACMGLLHGIVCVHQLVSELKGLQVDVVERLPETFPDECAHRFEPDQFGEPDNGAQQADV